MIGHHGTSKENARGILANGFRKSKGYQWFGDGVYFFEDDRTEARNWATKVKKFELNYAVLESDIKVENPLNLHKADQWNEFLELKREFHKEARKSRFGGKNITDGFVVEFMCRQMAKRTGKPIDVVFCGCNVPGYDWVKRVTNIPRVQTQVCVRELECITSVVLVEEAS